MSEYPLIIADCPACHTAKVTFDILANSYVTLKEVRVNTYDAFCRCRSCLVCVTFRLQEMQVNNGIAKYPGGTINHFFKNVGTTSYNEMPYEPPEFTPDNVRRIFEEGATCFSVGCYDAAGAMFRKSIDQATRGLLPQQPTDESHPNWIAWKRRKDLALRLTYLFDSGLLPHRLQELATCIREDGNDAAHDEQGIKRDEVVDLIEFTVVMLEEMYTLPGQIQRNIERRQQRRGG